MSWLRPPYREPNERAQIRVLLRGYCGTCFELYGEKRPVAMVAGLSWVIEDTLLPCPHAR